VLGKDPENRHLAIIDLAKPSKPLPGRPHRHWPLLGKTAFINQKAGLLVVTQKLIGITRHLINHTARIPFAVGQKLLQVSGLGIRYSLRHPVHVFTRPCLHQAARILPGFVRYIMPVGAEMVAEAPHKRHKAPADAGERRLRGGIRYSPLVMGLSDGCVSWTNVY
jgi:hypothetical protein